MRKNSWIIALCMLLAISCNQANNGEQKDETAVDSLEMARQDSIQKAEAEAKLNEERKVTEQQKRDEEAEKFCRQFSIEDLLDLLEHYGAAKIVHNGGLTFIYKEEIESTDGDVGEERVVYGREIEKGDKKDFGYNLKSTSKHSCYYELNLDTSTNPYLYFANKDDADSFYNRVANHKPFKYEGETYYINKNNGVLYIDTQYDEDSFETNYCLYQPELEDGFYKIKIDVWM
ncbi:MAG: hypothetical protein J5709_06545 [Bacteroidales bacterium]|nr:hypothetical protein [Bacteroidales bacterium]